MISPTTKLVVDLLEVKVRDSVPSLEASPSDTSLAVMVIVGLIFKTVKAAVEAVE